MANGLYTSFKQLLLGGDIDLANDDIKLCVIDTGTYTVNLATHNFHDDLTGIIATSANLSSKTITNGVFDAANVTISGVAGNESEAVVFWKDTGNSATSPLIAYYDTGTGFPIAENPGTIQIQFDADGIFEIGG
jgi:hypothetical protein